MRRILVSLLLLAAGCAPKTAEVASGTPAPEATPKHHLFHRHRLGAMPFPKESVSLPPGTLGVVRITKREQDIALVEIVFPIDFAIDDAEVAASGATKQTRLPVSLAGPLVLFDAEGRFAELGVQSGFQLVFSTERNVAGTDGAVGRQLLFRPLLHTTLALGDVEHAIHEGRDGVIGFAVVAEPKPLPVTRADRKRAAPAVVPDLTALPAESTDRALVVGRVAAGGAAAVALDDDPEGECGPETLVIRTADGDAELSSCGGTVADADATRPAEGVTLAEETAGPRLEPVATRSLSTPDSVSLPDGSVGVVRVLARYGNVIDAEVVFGSDFSLTKADGGAADYPTKVPVEIAGPLTVFDDQGPVGRGTVTSADLVFWCDADGMRHWRPVARVSIAADAIERPIAAKDGTHGVAAFALVGPPGSGVAAKAPAELTPLIAGKLDGATPNALLFAAPASSGCDVPVLRTADGDLPLECCGK